MKCHHGQFLGLYHTTSQRLRSPQKLYFSWSSLKPIQIGNTLACFIHFSLIRARNCALFFFFWLDSLFFEGYSYKIIEFLLTVSTSLFLAFLAPQAHLDAPGPLGTILSHLACFFNHLDTSLVQFPPNSPWHFPLRSPKSLRYFLWA